MIKLNREALKGEFSKNIITLFSGNSLAQMFNLLGTLIIYTQLYSSFQFGYLAIFMGISSIISVISAGRYEPAIVLPKEKEDGFSLLVLATSLVVICASTVIIVLFFLRSFYPSTLYLNELGGISYFIPLSILFFGLYQSLSYWFIRNKEYKTISGSKVVEAGMAFAVTVSIGYFFSYKFGLIIGYVSGQFFGFLFLFFSFLRSHFSELKTINFQRIWKNAKKYNDFPKYNLLHVFVDMLQKYGSVFIIERYFGYSILGNYHLAYRVLRGPLGLIGSAFSQVFYQKISELYNTGQNVYKFLKSSVFGLATYSIPLFAVGMLIIRPLFNKILGTGYEECGLIAQILIPWIAFNFISSPISTFPQILGKQRAFLIITSTGNVTSLFILFYLSKIGMDFTPTLIAFSGAMLLTMTCIIIWNLIIAKNSVNTLSVELEQTK